MHGGNAPAWQELPSETQAVLVNLMTQLMLEHAQRQAASATATVEASHDR
jgi:TRAP-type C4-dicarboxylate transport system substrate-binding protein